MQNYAQVVVEVGVVYVTCAERLVAITVTISKSKRQSLAAMSSQGIIGATGQQMPKNRFPETANGQPGYFTSHPPAVPVRSPLQSDWPPTSSLISTRTPDGLRTSTDISDKQNDTDLTDIETPHLFSSVLSTASTTVDATVTAPYLMQILVNFSRLFDASTLNMLPHVTAESMTLNITVTIYSVQTPMMLDSGYQISVLPSNIDTDFDLPISLPNVTRKVRTFGKHQVTLRGPLFLKLLLFGFRIGHPSYFTNASTPVIGGYDLMKAARLVVDVDNRQVWSRRSESATKSR